MSRLRRKRQPGRGTLVIIIALLIGSAIARLGGEAGQALASVSDRVAAPEAAAAETAQACKTPEDLRAMLAAFEARETRLDEREAALRDRMQALQVADEEISAKLLALEAAEESLRETIAIADSAAETDLDRLTKVYESMKPKQAAALFEEMDPNFAAGFLGRMRPEAAAEVMAGLSPESAHAFSVVLAGRNANVPTE
ncbi:MAG: hypothetical protein RID23_11985 [Roseovarius sp.]